MKPIQAIDVHGHYGLYNRREGNPLVNEWMTGNAKLVVTRAREANTELTVVSPLLGLLPRGEADTVAGNEEAARVVPRTKGLLQWVIVNPLQPKTYEQASRMLKGATCVGIKIHPEEHCYPITKHGNALFAFAAEHRAVVLAHSGDPNSHPMDFIPFANRFPEMRLILAHIGNGGAAGGRPDLQVRAIQASRRGNVFADTSSARSITPGLIEWAVREVGVEKVLYGTDTPLYFAPMQRTRIDRASLSLTQKRKILRDNARKLLGL